MTAAAMALHLIRDGAITPQGNLAYLTAQPTHRPVYDGDRPSRAEKARRGRNADLATAWAQAEQAINEWIDAARTDPEVAHQVLRTFTGFARNHQAYDRERRYLMGLGIPPSFLPEPEPGRFDLPVKGVR